MKINELRAEKALITRLPVDNDNFNKVAPANRIEPGSELDGTTFHNADSLDQAYIDRMRKLSGLTMGTGSEKGDMSSPLTHGASDRGDIQHQHHIEPGSDDWFDLWMAKPNPDHNVNGNA